ncbi:MAG: lipopolysaccharide biosynthesis protein [Alistipes sp.]|nr:lipopolysaccharide biosynthesis protein [Alistipes sp.]
MGEIKQQTLSGVKWSAIGRFSTQGVGFVIGLILARLLSPSDYGIVGMIGIFIAIAQSFIDSGFSSALIRKNDRTEVDYSTAFYFNIIIGIASYGLLFLLAPLIADFFSTPILKDVVRVVSINLFLNSLTIVQTAKLTVALDFKAQAKVSLITTIISGVIGIAFAYNGYGVWALVYQSVASSLLRVILLWVITKWIPLLTFSNNSFKSLFSFGGKILVSGLLHTIYMNFITLVIGKFYTPKDLGFYSRGESLASLPSTNITSILQSVTYPILSKLQDDDGRLIAVYRKYIAMSSMIIFFGMCLLAALAKPIVLFILTEKWAEAIIYLQIFCFALMFDHLCQLNLNILYVKGRSDLVLRLEIIKKVISISMIICAIPFGVLAICIARALYSQIAVYINTYYTGKIFGLGYIAQVKDFGGYFIGSLISVMPAYLLSLTALPNIVIIIIGSAIACAIYWSLFKSDEKFKEIISIVKSKTR